MRIFRPVRCLWIGVAALAVGCGGCRLWDQPQPASGGSPDDSKGWTDQMRPGTSEDVPTGTSPKAREIERNLGYR